MQLTATFTAENGVPFGKKGTKTTLIFNYASIAHALVVSHQSIGTRLHAATNYASVLHAATNYGSTLSGEWPILGIKKAPGGAIRGLKRQTMVLKSDRLCFTTQPLCREP
jgi:hypothetical protein